MVWQRCGLAGVSFDGDRERNILAREQDFRTLTLRICYVQNIVDTDE